MIGRRVVVTGLGAVTPLGNDLHATIAGWLDGRTACAPGTRPGATAFADAPAAEVRDFSPREHFRVAKAIKLTGRTTQFAVAAAAMALDDAGWPQAIGEREALGVAIGSSGSDLQPSDLARAIGPDPDRLAARDIASFADRILAGLHPLWLLVGLPNMVSAHVAIQCGARGPNTTIMTDWIAGSQAIGEACDWIRRGDVDAVLAGGADSGLYPFAYGSYEQSGLLDAGGGPDACPFVPGEGAALLLLEDRASAIARGARVLGEITGYAATSAPIDRAAAADGGALGDTMRAALEEAGWLAPDVQHIVNASVFDPRFLEIERAALLSTFGRAPGQGSVTAFTSRLGHALGAAGAIDAALALALVARRGGDRECRMLCNAVGYSGQAATLAIAAAPGAGARRMAS